MEMSAFAKTVMLQKYSHDSKETWEQIASRVATNVMGAIKADHSTIQRFITERKFMPGGRYLYASGREYKNVQNCLLLKVDDSREGWADLLHKASMALMAGAGIGVVYSSVRPQGTKIKKTGGVASGPIALMQMLNEVGRGIRQGGDRRSAIWAGLHWNHPDCLKFIELKNWSKEVKDLKAKDYNFPATMDGTNISVILDDEFFVAFHTVTHPLHSLASNIYWKTVRQMLETAEPGFSVDVGINAGEHLRNAPVCGETKVLTNEGYKAVIDIVGKPTTVWTGVRWAPNVIFNQTGTNVPTVEVKMTGGRTIKCDPSHEFFVEQYAGAGSRRKLVGISKVKAQDLTVDDILHVSLPISPTQNTFSPLYYTMGFGVGDGHWNSNNGLDISICHPSKESCINGLVHKKTQGVDKRGYTRFYIPNIPMQPKTGISDTIWKASAEHQCSFLAGLFDADGNLTFDSKRTSIRLSNVSFEFLSDIARLLESLGIIAHISKGGKTNFGTNKQMWQLSVASDYITVFANIIPTLRLPLQNFAHSSYRKSHIRVISVTPSETANVYCCDVKFFEHSFMAEGVIISNCTEVTSKDDSDICNLGSINLARIESLEEMREIVKAGVEFLIAGTQYSDVPYEKVAAIRNKNRRLGLGLMGIHEWLLKHGKRYGPDKDLAEYLAVYASSGVLADDFCRKLGISAPVKTRALAPTGTISILAETTSGIEPIFCVAYKRRYLKGDLVNYQYVVDPTAKRLIEAGVKPEQIEDAYSLAENVERRVEFQAWMQQYVDHAISSTINLPPWGSALNNESRVEDFGNMLIKYLPKLRGITCYPDGARGGQPLTPVKYQTAIKHIGEVFVEQADVCDITKGGSCGV
jgi:ribonucleotide reductase alpha subunit